MKFTLLSFAFVATVNNALTLEKHDHNHLTELQNHGTNAIRVNAMNARRRRVED